MIFQEDDEAYDEEEREQSFIDVEYDDDEMV